MERVAFIERLHSGVIVCDGAMGTLLYAKGVYVNRCFEGLNVQSPDLIREVHDDYVKAGAEIIETNTFGANRPKLLHHGLEDQLELINRKGVELARCAAGDTAYVAGSVGPIGKSLEPFGSVSFETAREAFREQIAILADAGIDLLVLETFSQLDEIRVALESAREVTNLPIVAQMTVSDAGKTVFGVTPEEIVKVLVESGATVVGLNCGVGPKETMDALTRMRRISSVPLSAQPNAGFPQLIEGRTLYLSTPEYMAVYARRMFESVGLSIVGGCCGTTPSHIRAIRSVVRMLQPAQLSTPSLSVQVSDSQITPQQSPLPIEDFSPLAAKLRSGSFVKSVEISPPQGTNLEKTLACARLCAEAGIDCINIPDGPRASARMSPIALATLLKSQIAVDPIVHLCCRDRNLIGMQADLLGLNSLGIYNVLLVTGDPPKLGDYPDATAVFDVDSIGLVRITDRLNHGTDLAGKSIGMPTALFISVGADPGAIDFEREIARLQQKVDAGATCVFTQPVFDLKLFERFQQATKHLNIPILVGILPLSSYRNAEFLHNEVPGMSIPQDIRDRMQRVGSGPMARAEGIAIAREALQECRNLAQGVYIMPPFNNVQAALDVLKE